MEKHDTYESHREFLLARTKPDFGDGRPVDWDSYVTRSSGNLKPPVVDSIPGTLSPEASAQITQISTRLIETFKNIETYKKFLDHRGDSALDLLDLLQKLLDYRPLKPQFRVLLYVALVRLCRKSELCPRSLHFPGVSGQEGYPHSAGYFGDIYKAYYKGKHVCLKAVKLYAGSDESKMLKAFSREAVVWAQLSHPNILPFYGIHYIKDLQLGLVSPWISGGNVVEFLDNTPNANRHRLIQGIAAGMKYLHDNGVVHGDLKPLNILVLEPEQALLIDFGFSYITDDDGLEDPSLSSSHSPGGSQDYAAPEIFENPYLRKTKECDVFAFGMVWYELLTHSSPAKYRNPPLSFVHLRIMNNPPGLPDRITGLTDEMWDMMKACWLHKPDGRPTAADIVQCLPPVEMNYASNDWLSLRPGFKSSEEVDDTIQKALRHL